MSGITTVMYDSPLSDKELERRAAKLRADWEFHKWECMSGIFAPAADRLGYCYCCGFKLNPEDHE